MEMLHSHSDHLPMTFDEISMERSKNFVKALQELKNLRPQLYSAAEYCEKSYLNSEQKQMVLYNLKDYALQALVTAVDHLGTVAYKLNDLFEQQTLDISTMELNISHLNEKLLTCQIYTEKEGLRQQQFLTTIPRHHKHYILPNSVNKKVQFSPQIQTDARQQSTYSRPRANPSGTNAAQTLSWHLASETISTLNATNHALIRPDDSKASGTTSGAFHLLDSKEVASSKSSPSHLLSASRSPAFSPSRKTFGVKLKESIEASRPSTPFRSFDKMNHHETVRAPSRSKSILSAFFPKQKTAKPISIYTK